MDILYITLYVLLALASIFILFYRYVTSTYSHWKARGVPYIKPSFPFGNLGDTILGRKSLIDLTLEQYRQFPAERFFGIFNLNKPVLVLRDPSLIERVLITDFTHFCNKVDVTFKDTDSLAFHLGNLQGDTWRQLRKKLIAAFSASKLKHMTELVSSCGDSIIETISSYESKKEPAMVDCIGFSYSVRVIANCIFGVECDGEGLQSFTHYVKKYLFKMKVVNMIHLWYIYVPSYAWLLYWVPPIANVVGYFKNLTEGTIAARKQSQTRRNDFLQILLDLMEEDGGDEEMKNGDTALKKVPTQNLSSETKHILSHNFITSQLFIFTSLGMESSAVTIAFILLDLASNPDIQRRVQQEIDQVVHNGELSYDALQQMSYLDTVIQESTRMFPGFPYIMRVCQSPYKIPGSDLVLEKGDTVLIPSFAVQLDPQNYPDPENFNPDRFIDNHYKPSATYLPFGAGPRMCVALKLVIVKLKLAIVKVMSMYSVKLSPKTERPLRFAPQFMPKLLNGLWLEFESRKP